MRLALTIVVAVAASLLPAPAALAADTGGAALAADSGEAALTTDQLEDFAAAARAAGIDEELIAAASTDPDLALGIPVSVEVETPAVEEVPAMPDQPGLELNGLTSRRVRGYWAVALVTYRNILGWRLMSFGMTKTWEADGRRIVSAPKPTPRIWVTNTGAAAGWDYSGIIGSSDYYFRYLGYSRGGHKSYRQGKFTQCFLDRGCIWKVYPKLSIRAYANGRSSSWAGR